MLLALLLCLRIGFGLFGSGTFDVSAAGVLGADRIEHGQELYTDNEFHPDTYGPVNYLAYLPFEFAFPYDPADEKLPAAQAATLCFDLLVVAGLFLLGRQIRGPAGGTRLGVALGYGWAAYPYTSLVIASNTNDALVPLFVILALLTVRSPARRGLALGLGTMTKFAPALLGPAFARGLGPLRVRTAAVFAAAFAATCAVVLIPLLPDGGLREFWNTTLGFQLGRSSPLSLWQRHRDLDWLQTAIKVAVVFLATASAFVPRRRTIGQLAALSGALLAGSQLVSNYWIYFYAVWLAPFLLIGSFAEHRDLGPGTGQVSDTSDFVKPERISEPESVTATRSSIRTPSTPGR